MQLYHKYDMENHNLTIYIYTHTYKGSERERERESYKFFFFFEKDLYFINKPTEPYREPAKKRAGQREKQTCSTIQRACKAGQRKKLTAQIRMQKRQNKWRGNTLPNFASSSSSSMLCKLMCH